MHEKLLCYGPPGSFKTTSALLWAPKPILVADADCKAHKLQAIQPLIEKGDVIIKPFPIPLVDDPLRVRTLNPDNPPSKRPRGYLEIVNYLNDVIEGLPEIPRFETLVVDSLTRILEHLKRLIAYTNKRNVLAERDWLVLLSNLEELFGGLIPMEKNIIVIAHERLEKDDESGRLLGIKPAIDGQMREKVAGYFDEAWHYEPMYGSGLGKTIFQVRVEPTRTTTARTARYVETPVMDVKEAFRLVWPNAQPPEPEPKPQKEVKK